MSVAKPFLDAGFVGTAILALISLGCSGGGGSPSTYAPPGEGTHIAQAAMHVSKYLAENKGKAPKDTGEMKDWAAKNSIPEDQLVSTRDKQPYQVHHQSQGRGAAIILTETTGAKGKKFMYNLRQGGRAPSGSELSQEEIDNALQAPSRAGGGRPG